QGNIKLDDVQTTSAAMQNDYAQTIGLPTQQIVTFVRGGAWTTRLGTKSTLGPLSIGALSGAESQMAIKAGKWPPAAPTQPGDPLPVLIPEKMMDMMGIQVGDSLTSASPAGKPLQLKVAAIWQPINANDPNWIFPPKAFDEVLLVQPADLPTALNGIAKPVEESDWFMIFN